MPSTLGILGSSRPNTVGDAWKAAYARAAVGGGQAHVACVGTSVTHGFGGTDWDKSWPAVMESYIRTTTGVTPGTGFVLAADLGWTTDSRFTLSSGWDDINNVGYGLVGWSMVNETIAGAVSMEFTPTQQVTGFRMFGIETAIAGNGTRVHKIDGSTVGSYGTAAGGWVLNDRSYSTTLGAHTFRIEHSQQYTREVINAIEGIVNPTSGVKVSKLGRYASTAPSVLQDDSISTTPKKLLGVIDPDLVMWEFGLNEFRLGTAASTPAADLAAMCDWALARGTSVVCVIAPPPSDAWAGAGWNTYADTIRTTANSYGIGLLDFTALWGSYAANPTYYSDLVHLSNAGYAEMGRVAAEFVLNYAA